MAILEGKVYNVIHTKSLLAEVAYKGSGLIVKISKGFIKGYIRALKLIGTKQWPDISNGRTKDYNALRSDWRNVGESIRRETRNFKQARS